MRIVLLTEYPIDGFVTGGAAKVGQRLADRLAARPGLEVHVLFRNASRAGDLVVEKGALKVHAIGARGLLPVGIKQYLGPRRRAVRAIASIRPDVAHAQDATSLLCALEAGVPAVLTVHGMYTREAGLTTGLRWLTSRIHLHYFKKGLRKARYLIAISPYVEQELRSHTGAEFIHIPNPVDAPFFGLDPGRAEPGRVLFVGLVSRRKCVLELVQAFRRVHAAHPEARLRLVGEPRDPAYLAEVQDYVAREGLGEAVRYVGAVPEADLLQEYERSALLVLMSRQETAPGTIGEAMAAGKAVVASRICGIPYMVEDGVTGLLAEPGDAAGFADRILRLLEDPALCREMGRRGREKALRDYHPDRVVDATLRVYQRVIEKW